jgi:type I restriction-modification system DNA methylase subunit
MNTESIKTIKDFKSLAHFLAEELSWPIDPDNVDVDDLVFEYKPEDIGLSDEFAAKVQAIKQIRPLDANQPWSIFWIDFENKKLPLTVLRRILNAFVNKRRGNSRNIATKEMEDIMFVSGHGEDRNRAITFAHFKRLDDVETIREFYWDGHETKFDHIASYLEKLEWPNNTTDIEGWRKKWKAAFTGSTREAITTSDQLAQAMAKIAKNIRDRVLEILDIEPQSGPVHKLYDTFRSGLVHDMTETGFADMYAQTITYGLFSARTMDTDGHFELHEVIDLIPTTNPFLKNLFRECLSTGDKNNKIDLDELGVGRLVDLFDNLNKSDGTDGMQRILAEFGRQTFSGQEDPVIHFYEGFLKEYDNLQRVEKGVYYTPDPVVKFIVRSVNEQLKSEFGLEYGLADTTTWAEMVSSGRADYPVDPNTVKVNKEWTDKIKGRAFVQILDPATGTGTFLKHVIEVILEEVKLKFKKDQISGTWEDYWNSYVYSSLLPRIYGFELMMASYSVAHMKLGMFLKSTGYKFEKEQRLNIYLTNSLEPYTSNSSANLFFTSVGAESAGANDVKKNRFFSVVIGNPPYSGISNNKDPWITNLIEDYKYIDGVHFNERKHWLNDDYVKFIRLGEYLISKNGVGVLGYINPHGFLDNPTFRGMRWHLLNAFDKIQTIDLHGNTKKKETSPDGSADINVFDIQQGVSINIFLKTKKKLNDCSKLFHFDLYGKRESKYEFLLANTLKSILFNSLYPEKSNFFFVPKNNDGILDYERGFRINELFPINNVGFVSANDGLNISMSEMEHRSKINDILTLDESSWRIKYKRPKDADSWKYKWAKEDALLNKDKDLIKVSYRPFDFRYSLYTGKSGGLYARPINQIMSHFIKGSNVGIVYKFGNAQQNAVSAMVTKNIIDFRSWSRPGMQGGDYVSPLYIYQSNQVQKTIEFQQDGAKPNISIETIKVIAKSLNLKFVNENSDNKEIFSPIDVLDYVYAVLHSPKYRKKYNEFLKIDFPRVPYPNNSNTFWQLVNLGSELRKIHLFESYELDNFITSFPVSGSNEVVKKLELKDNKVYINNEQYFDGVSEIAWNFYIGGYQPAQKWLKDRKGRILTDDDIIHYQKIIVALTETDRLMKEIDKIDFMEGVSSVQYFQEESMGLAADSVKNKEYNKF